MIGSRSTITIHNHEWQNTTLVILRHQHISYKLRGMVIHRGSEKGHYTAVFWSSVDPTQWFYVNDAEVGIKQYRLSIVQHCTCIYMKKQCKHNYMQVTPISVATALLQDPYILYYELHEGLFHHRIYIVICTCTHNIIEQRTIIYGVWYGTIGVQATPSLRECQALYGQQWLTDEVFTSIMYMCRGANLLCKTCKSYGNMWNWYAEKHQRFE